ncbi:LPXTG cell wall anchor domain-containing protein [Nocardioides sp. MH1]|uniref:LPXTG cell wall anchor domain-containing protein n=1 Tax=Nocardioides sp. MH1 TaxID=3242490 RepID=UPI003521910D
MYRVLCSVLLAAVVLTTGAGAARADDEVGLSLDGHQWSASLSRPLFDPAFRWVPGDTETRSLWVRNQGPTAASMEVGMRTLDPDALVQNEDLRIDARVHHGSWLPLTADGTAQTLLDRGLEKGARVRIDLRVAFDPASTNVTQVRTLPLKFVVRLTQSAPRGDGGPHGTDGDLPDTGSTVQPWQLWLAGGLIGCGIALVVRRRKEEETDG